MKELWRQIQSESSDRIVQPIRSDHDLATLYEQGYRTKAVLDEWIIRTCDAINGLNSSAKCERYLSELKSLIRAIEKMSLEDVTAKRCSEIYHCRLILYGNIH